MGVELDDAAEGLRRSLYYQQQRESEKVGLGQKILAAILIVFCVLVFLPYVRIAPRVVKSITAPVYTDQTAPPDGDPQYPVPLSKAVTYWVINCTPVNPETIVAADRTLENLRADHIAETAILCMPKNSVHDPVGYAIRFTRYMELGLKDGPRRDNGFTWLILYDAAGIEIHEGIGLGLNKFTQVDIAPVQAKAEKAFANGGIDSVVTTLTTEYDKMARANYDPYQPVPPSYPSADAAPDSTDPMVGGFLFTAVLWVIVAYLGFLLVAEPILSVGVILSSAACWMAMWFLLWFPIRVVFEVLQFLPVFGGSFGRSSGSLGRSGSGGGESARGN
jgi:hypothetical protein